MRNPRYLLLFTFCFLIVCSAHAQIDSLIYAEGRVINAATKELIAAKITYESLPYGNKIGVLNNSAYSFPMFDNEKYSIVVEAPGFALPNTLPIPLKATAAK